MAISAKQISRYRGDTHADVVRVREGATDLANPELYDFVLSVSTEENPTAASYLYQLTGVDVSADGQTLIAFTPSAVQADQTPATYYYDVQKADTGTGDNKQTIVKDEYVYLQDINKS